MRAANKRDLTDFLLGKRGMEIFHAICGGGQLTHNAASRIVGCTGCASNWSAAFIYNASEQELAVRFSIQEEPAEEVYKLIEMEDGPNIYTKLVKVT